MAPVAAHIVTGMAPESVGGKLDINELCTLPEITPEIDTTRGIIRGEIINIDRFGNLTSNISQDIVRRIFKKVHEKSIHTTINGHSVLGLEKSYDSVAENELLVIFGSRNLLEIAANKGSAASVTGAAPGDEVTVITQT